MEHRVDHFGFRNAERGLIKGARHKTQGVRPFGSSSKFKVQSSKFKNSPLINQKTWNLEPGTLNLIELAKLAQPANRLNSRQAAGSQRFASLAFGVIKSLRCAVIYCKRRDEDERTEDREQGRRPEARGRKATRH
jgi:hypothetical protein